MPNARTTSVQRTGELFREAGSSLILREAFFGVRRFEEFQRNLGISRSVLTSRLRSLVERGILERQLYQTRPDRFEYRLTEAGLELYPIFLAMKTWGDRWLGDESAAIRLHHKTCGHDSHPQMTCDYCGERIAARDMSYELDQGTQPSPKGS